MASRRITGFADRLKVLERIAYRYVGWRFELDELVNQMWLSRAVRQAQEEHHLVRAGRNAMYDYFRTELGKNKNPEPLWEQATIEEVIDDTWMDLDVMTSGFTRTQKLIVKLRCDWFTWPEVAKVAGLTRSNARYHLGNAPKERIEQWAKA